MNMSQETELYKCSCGHIQMGSPDAIAAISKGIVNVNCPSCSKGIILFKCLSCDQVGMVEARTVNEVAPGVVNVICPKCNNTNRFKKR
jgi:predicted SprT family Zn-dependent metalloprotease